MKSKMTVVLVAFVLALGWNKQDALASSFDGDWELDKSRMKQTELVMGRQYRDAGMNKSGIALTIQAVEEVWSNIVIREGRFSLSGEGKTAICTITATGNAGTISCNTGVHGQGAIRINGSVLSITPSGAGASFFFRRKNQQRIR